MKKIAFIALASCLYLSIVPAFAAQGNTKAAPIKTQTNQKTTLNQKPSKTGGVWGPEADKVCQALAQASQLYQQGQIGKAHLTAVMAYFKVYDTNMEPAVRTVLGGPHVFQIEQQFSAIPKAMSANPSSAQKQQVTKMTSKLCQAIQKEALALNKAKVKKQVYNVG